MTGPWIEALPLFVAQHMMQGAALALLALLLPALRRWVAADARSWILASAFLLAVVSPLAVFLPGESVAAQAAAHWLPGDVAVPSTQTVASITVAGGGIRPVTPDSPRRGIAPSAWTLACAVAACVWLLGLAWNLRRLAASWLEAVRLRARATQLPDATRRFAGTVPGNVEIRVSGEIRGPLVVGFARPCILLPRGFVEGLPDPTLARILRHEVAHVHRRDMWALLLQALCLSVYWWSPVLRFLGKQLDAVREMACDERAAMHADDPVSYAGALLDGAAVMRIPADTRGVLGAGILDSRAGLAQRIEGLLNMNPRKHFSGPRAIVGACGLVVLASVSLSLLASPRIDSVATSAETSSRASGDGAVLIEAVNARRLDVLRTLVRRGLDIDAGVEGDGTALIVAARNGDIEAVDALLRLGAGVDRPMPGDGNPLIAAAARGHLDVVEQLVAANADINAIVVGDETPLINAARSGDLQVVAYLVEHGADVNLGVMADRGQWRSPLNQAPNARVRDYLAGKGAVPHR